MASFPYFNGYVCIRKSTENEARVTLRPGLRFFFDLRIQTYTELDSPQNIRGYMDIFLQCIAKLLVIAAKQDSRAHHTSSSFWRCSLVSHFEHASFSRRLCLPLCKYDIIYKTGNTEHYRSAIRGRPSQGNR